jgi:hypothetical protein
VWVNVAWFHICIHCQGSLQVFFLLQASPEQSKKQAEDADRAMNKNLEKNRQAEQETAPEPKERDGSEAEVAEAKVCSGIAALVRKTKQKSAGRAIKDTLHQASPEEIKKKQEDADRVMMEILEEEQEAAVAAAAVSQKKKQAKEGKERRNADRQVGIEKVEQGEEQNDDSERTEARDESEKNKTENVATVEVAAGLKDKAEEQEWDGDDGLLNESSAKRKSRNGKKGGDQGASASKPALMVKQAREAGAPAAGVGVEAGSWPPPLQANVEVAAITMSAAAAEAELLFMSKFNFSSGEAGIKANDKSEEKYDTINKHIEFLNLPKFVCALRTHVCV